MGCSPHSKLELIPVKTHDYNENYTRHFETGEFYYIQNVEEKYFCLN